MLPVQWQHGNVVHQGPLTLHTTKGRRCHKCSSPVREAGDPGASRNLSASCRRPKERWSETPGNLAQIWDLEGRSGEGVNSRVA